MLDLHMLGRIERKLIVPTRKEGLMAEKASHHEAPACGQIVHYTLPEGRPHAGECRAAIVSLVLPATRTTTPVNLVVFKGEKDDADVDGPTFPANAVEQDDGGAPGTWCCHRH